MFVISTEHSGAAGYHSLLDTSWGGSKSLLNVSLFRYHFLVSPVQTLPFGK